MWSLEGQGFLADTDEPSASWLEAYIAEEDQPQVLEAIEAAITGKHVIELEHRVRRPDGSLGWTLSRAVPLFADDGTIEEWIGAARDISDRHAV